MWRLGRAAHVARLVEPRARTLLSLLFSCACSPLLLLLLLCGDHMSFLHTCSHSGIWVWADVAVLLYGVLDVLSQCVFGIILLRKPPPALSDWDQEEKYQVLSLPALGDSRRMLTYAVPIADVC